MSTQQERILDLKRRAVALKQAGDVQGAMALLVQAREIEYENASIDDLWDPSQLRQLAVVLKNKGDMEGARAALVKAQQQQQQQQQQESDPVNEVESSVNNNLQQQAADTAEETKTIDNGVEENQDTTVSENFGNTTKDEDSDAELEALMQQEQQEEQRAHDDGSSPVTFSDEEMLDQEMMTEFKASGIAVPSDEDYQAKILACKKSALACKNAGDLARATAELRKSKQLEAVRVALSEIQDGGDDDFGWMTKELSEEDANNNNQDTSLNDISENNNNNSKNSMRLDLEDIDDMDSDMLRDAVEMGMEIPSPEDVLALANEKKMLAVENKKNGNIQGAMAALSESKQLQVKATKLEEMLKEINSRNNGQSSGGSDAIQMEDLEALLQGEATTPSAPRQPEPQQIINNNQLQVPCGKSAEELKQEAVRLRNEKNMVEATKVFKLYKEALQKEANEAELVRRKKLVANIQSEMELAQKQERLLEFYSRFVDSDAALTQLEKWKPYAEKCAKVQKVIQVKGTNSVLITRNNDLMRVQLEEDDGMAGMVERGCDPSDERLEVAIVDLRNVQENKTLKKMLNANKDAAREKSNNNTSSSSSCTNHTLRVEVTIQLPPSNESSGGDADKSIDLVFEPSNDNSSEQEQTPAVYQFGESQHVNLPVRGDSRQAKTLLRRMERRKIITHVYHVPYLEKRKGWFRGASSEPDQDRNNWTLLGKIVLELKDLLTRNCIAGDFPLMGAGSKMMGGVVGMAVRTGVPFDPEKSLAIDREFWTDILVPHDGAMSFSLAAQQQQKQPSQQ